MVVWSSDRVMNNFTRHLVYPSILFAFTALTSNAESIHMQHDSEAVHPALATSDPMPGFAGVTESSFSEGSSLNAHNSSFNMENEASGNGAETQGKGVKAPGPTADDESSPVDDASSTVGGTVDPSDLSITTTTSDDSFGGGPIIVTNDSTGPEPGTLILVGSMFVGFGLFRRTRGKSVEQSQVR